MNSKLDKAVISVRRQAAKSHSEPSLKHLGSLISLNSSNLPQYSTCKSLSSTCSTNAACCLYPVKPFKEVCSLARHRRVIVQEGFHCICKKKRKKKKRNEIQDYDPNASAGAIAGYVCLQLSKAAADKLHGYVYINRSLHQDCLGNGKT